VREINTHNILIAELQRETRLWRPSSIWEDTVKMDPTELKWKGIDWNRVAPDMVQYPFLFVNMITNSRVPFNLVSYYQSFKKNPGQ